jgi:hypothetical protein
MKKIIFPILLSLLFVGGIVGISMAGYGYHGKYGYGSEMQDMLSLDGDGDSQISFEEFSAPQMDRLKSAFKMLDTDKDGVISKGEYNEFLKVHGLNPESDG